MMNGYTLLYIFWELVGAVLIAVTLHGFVEAVNAGEKWGMAQAVVSVTVLSWLMGLPGIVLGFIIAAAWFIKKGLTPCRREKHYERRQKGIHSYLHSSLHYGWRRRILGATLRGLGAGA